MGENDERIRQNSPELQCIARIFIGFEKTKSLGSLKTKPVPGIDLVVMCFSLPIEKTGGLVCCPTSNLHNRPSEPLPKFSSSKGSRFCHCERSEAISRSCRIRAGDCFVASLLAMTLIRVPTKSVICKLFPGHNTRTSHPRMRASLIGVFSEVLRNLLAKYE